MASKIEWPDQAFEQLSNNFITFSFIMTSNDSICCPSTTSYRCRVEFHRWKMTLRGFVRLEIDARGDAEDANGVINMAQTLTGLERLCRDMLHHDSVTRARGRPRCQAPCLLSRSADQYSISRSLATSVAMDDIRANPKRSQQSFRTIDISITA